MSVPCLCLVCALSMPRLCLSASSVSLCLVCAFVPHRTVPRVPQAHQGCAVGDRVGRSRKKWRLHAPT
eukprot:scaffold246042_cov23-Tisochrysis_lutea.AAC.1